jgi:hypothetical protein
MYFINEKNLIHYLHAQGMINLELVFSSRLKIINLSNRNFNYVFEVNESDGYFLKQNKIQEVEFIQSIQIEANLYNNVGETGSNLFKSYIPRFISFDSTSNILITGLELNTINLQAHLNSGPLSFLYGIAGKQAQILSVIHSSSSILTTHSIGSISKKKPWIFEITETDSKYKPKNELGRQIIQVLKENEKYRSCVKVAVNNYLNTHLIHGDVKFSNFILKKDYNSKYLKLVDWEIASIGDPAWDVAGIWQSYIWALLYARYTPLQDENMALLSFKKCVKSFWLEYKEALPLGTNEKDLYYKSIQFAGIRIIQTCLESTQTSLRLPLNTVKLMQLGVNTVINPSQTADSLFSF